MTEPPMVMTSEEFRVWNETSTAADAWLEYRLERELDLAQRALWPIAYRAGWDAHADMIDNCWRDARAVLKSPSQAELAKRRAVTNEPCPGQCGRCGRCFRAQVAAENVRRYGSADYPGADAAAAICREKAA